MCWIVPGQFDFLSKLRSNDSPRVNRQHRRQSTLRSRIRTWHGLVHIRLGASPLGRKPYRNALVGNSESLQWLWHNLLDSGTGVILFKCTLLCQGHFSRLVALSGADLRVIPEKTWYSVYMPMNSNDLYDRFGRVYDLDRVLFPDYTLNTQGYRDYSPVYLPLTYAVFHNTQFALLTSSIVHYTIYYGQFVWKCLRYGLAEDLDIHNKLMSQYSQVPRR